MLLRKFAKLGLLKIFLVLISGCNCLHTQTKKSENITVLNLSAINKFETSKFTDLICQGCGRQVATCRQLLAVREPSSYNAQCSDCQISPKTCDTGRCKTCKKETCSSMFNLCTNCAILSDTCARSSCNRSLSNPPQNIERVRTFIIAFRDNEPEDPKIPYEQRLDAREIRMVRETEKFQIWLNDNHLTRVKIKTVMVAIRLVIIECTMNEAALIEQASQIKFVDRS